MTHKAIAKEYIHYCCSTACDAVLVMLGFWSLVCRTRPQHLVVLLANRVVSSRVCRWKWIAVYIHPAFVCKRRWASGIWAVVWESRTRFPKVAPTPSWRCEAISTMRIWSPTKSINLISPQSLCNSAIPSKAASNSASLTPSKRTRPTSLWQVLRLIKPKEKSSKNLDVKKRSQLKQDVLSCDGIWNGSHQFPSCDLLRRFRVVW